MSSAGGLLPHTSAGGSMVAGLRWVGCAGRLADLFFISIDLIFTPFLEGFSGLTCFFRKGCCESFPVNQVRHLEFTLFGRVGSFGQG